MTVAAAVDALLRKHHVIYHIADLLPGRGPEGARGVRCALLQHDEQRLQVLYPADSLLDLHALHTTTSTPWRALNHKEVRRICTNLHLIHPPALPGVLGMAMVADASLLQAPEVWLDAGDGQFVRISGSSFRQLLGDAPTHHCSIPLDQLTHRTDADPADTRAIHDAVVQFTPRRIRQRLEETLGLPPLPPTAERIIQLHVDPYADIKTLADIVESDPALAAQVISWAASPYYAAPGRIRSVHDAIVRVLGFDLVMNLALGIALGRTLRLPPEHPEGFTPYWQQAVFGAAAVEALVAVMPRRQRPAMGQAYLSGLLHNFGYLLLADIFPPQFRKLCQLQSVNPHVHHSHIEHHLLGVTRDQLAAWLTRLWGLPAPIHTALYYQNAPDYAGPDHAYPLLVFTATRLLRLHGIGDAAREPIPAAVHERLSLDPAAAKKAVSDVVEAGDALREIARLF